MSLPESILRKQILQRRHYRLALFASLLSFCVVVLGAYTRLTDAGLGCPDWPTCYGQLTVPSQLSASTHQLINITKAWTEMTHRYVAGILGMVIFALAILAIRNRRYPNQPLALPLTLVLVLVFQALLGMWTVTLKLFPLVVIAHLLGGLTTLSLLWWLTLKLRPVHIPNASSNFSSEISPTASPEIAETSPQASIDKLYNLKIWAILGLVVLAIQLFLGGWTSANYAALVCTEFPGCQGSLVPPLDFIKAFNLISAGVLEGFGNPMDNIAKVTIHVMHRVGALITALIIGWLAFLVFARTKLLSIRILSVAIAVLLTIQILLGVTNVLAKLPLPIAIAHNAVAALLLLALVTLNYYLHAKPRHRI